eukprot:Plantae.Rhodophyta-Hildenbrandia_rubra.ctg683.p2 GENE.Plantae.Rhodophyta-Hildenbrandia_rubra.ctg683~~Plantae.Rhodophyta-Hildenbrandia_rubra.ctg683.p2  ORF type:complete len:463 (-),score=94.53 Plantae.Rhodophyta-Hildenbrandia_rubra.ctg683:7392-8780(-)
MVLSSFVVPLGPADRLPILQTARQHKSTSFHGRRSGLPCVRRARYMCSVGNGKGLFDSGSGNSDDKGPKDEEGSEMGENEKDEEKEEDEVENVENLKGDENAWGIKFSFRKLGKEGRDTEGEEDDDEDPGKEDSGDEAEEGSKEGAEEENVVLADLMGKIAGGIVSDDGNELFEGVKKWGLEDMDDLQKLVSEEAQEAMKRTMMGMFGSLPVITYDVQIGTTVDGMTKVMLASLSNGYLLRNAEMRMTLNDSLSGGGLDFVNGKESTSSDSAAASNVVTEDVGDTAATNDAEPDYMKNVPKRDVIKRSAVSGEVEWWDAHTQQKAHMDAGEYIGKLESEVDLLRSRLEAKKVVSNRLLEFISTISPQKITELQSGLSLKALNAMKSVIQRILGVVPSFKIQQSYLGNRDYFAQIALWSMMVGYCIKNIENRLEIERIFSDDTQDSGSSSKGSRDGNSKPDAT